MLSIIQIANYAFPLIVIPFLVRTLGVDVFGRYALAQAFIQYIIILTEYGFNLTSTRDIAQCRSDTVAVGRIFLSTMAAKTILFVSVVPPAMILVVFVQEFRESQWLTSIGLVAVLGSILTPVWYFQGREKVGVVAGSLVCARLVCLALFPILVRDQEDVNVAMLLYSAPQLLVGVFCQIYLCARSSMIYRNINAADVRDAFRKGWHVFLSRISVTLYYTINPMVIALLWDAAAVGTYSAAEKIVYGVSGLSAPVVQAIYPRVSRLVSKSSPKAKTFMLWSLGAHAALGVVLGVSLFFLSPTLVHLLYGREHADIAMVLAVMSPVPVLVTVGSAAGLQVLLAAGRDREFSRSIMLGALFNLIALVPLTYLYGAFGAAISAVASQMVVVGSQAYYVIKTFNSASFKNGTVIRRQPLLTAEEYRDEQ